MSKKNIQIISLLFLLVLAFALIYFKNFNSPKKFRELTINGHTFRVEIVKKEEDLQRGLGDRKELCQTCGMLFEFPEKGNYDFWMKDMRFPLDIIWISQGKIVHLEKNINAQYAGILKSEQGADSVLEINAGSADIANFKPGDLVNY